MNIEEFIKKIENEFVELQPGTLGPDDSLRDLIDWSSLNALILMALIKTDYGIVISSEGLRKCETVRQIFEEMIERNKN